MADELFDGEILTLTDEEGNENQFEVIGSRELDGITYMALIPFDDKGDDREEVEYVILKMDYDEDGEEVLVTIDDDDEFDRIADIFDEELFGEIDYDDFDPDDLDEDFDE
ncbi:MAG: DUF1292 domain-containing protein [Clostridiales bacterium]|jgi:uncharacterized protein YrzB (UPF0473 family)|nr:DUF1292 domain-containing protein [Clostridiales bacterium]